MENIFDRLGETLHKGYLVTAEFVEGSHGTIDIHRFDSLELGELSSGHRAHYTVEGGKRWAGALEPTDFDQGERDRQPYNRMDPTTYIGCRLDNLDVIPTANGSRFLSLKKGSDNGSYFTASDKDGTFSRTREVAVVVYSKHELASYLQTLLAQIGVPHVDILKISKDIVGKIG